MSEYPTTFDPNNKHQNQNGYEDNGMNDLFSIFLHEQQQQQQQHHHHQQHYHQGGMTNTTTSSTTTNGTNNNANVQSSSVRSNAMESVTTSNTTSVGMNSQKSVWQILEDFSRSFLNMSVFDVADIWVPVVDTRNVTAEMGTSAALPLLTHVSTVAQETQNEEFISFHCLNCMVTISAWDGCVGQAFASGLPIWSSDEQVIWDFNRATMFRKADIKTAFSFPVFFAGSLRPNHPSCVISFYSRSEVEPNETVMGFVSHTLVATVPNVVKPDQDTLGTAQQSTKASTAATPNTFSIGVDPYQQQFSTSHSHAVSADRFQPQQKHTTTSYHPYRPHELETTMIGRKRPAIEISDLNYLNPQINASSNAVSALTARILGTSKAPGPASSGGPASYYPTSASQAAATAAAFHNSLIAGVPHSLDIVTPSAHNTMGNDLFDRKMPASGSQLDTNSIVNKGSLIGQDFPQYHFQGNNLVCQPVVPTVNNSVVDAAKAASQTSTKICRIQGCNNGCTGRKPLCVKHSGNRLCEYDGCSKCAQGSTRFCIAHGGGRRCTFPGCDKGARDKFFCAAHGGGKRCKEPGCGKSAVGGSNLCTSHGGGRRCNVEGCTKSAQASTKFCVRHGGGKKCATPGCEKVARGRTNHCASHGGGVRCRMDGCNRVAIGKRQLCRAHGQAAKQANAAVALLEAAAVSNMATAMAPSDLGF